MFTNYIKLSDDTIELFKKIFDITEMPCSIKNNFIEFEDLIYMIKDLYHNYELLEEKFNSYKEHIKECYRQKTPYEMDMEDI